MTSIGATVVTNTLYCRTHGLVIPDIPKELNIVAAHPEEMVKTPIQTKKIIDTYIDYEFLEHFGLNWNEYLETPTYVKETMMMKINEIRRVKKNVENAEAAKASKLKHENGTL